MLTNVAITDTFPVSVSIVPGSVYPPPDLQTEQTIEWYFDEVPAFGTGELGLMVDIREDAPDGLILDTGAKMYARETGIPKLGYSNVVEHFLNTIRYDLGVLKDDGLEEVNPGDTITYTIAYTHENLFDLTLDSVVFTETLPTYVNYVSGNPPWAQVTGSPGVFTTSLTGLAPGVSGTLDLVAQVSPFIPKSVGVISNTVELEGFSLEGVETELENNIAYDADVVIPLSYDLSISKTDYTTTAKADTVITYTITYSNQNALDIPLLGVEIVDTLDPAAYMDYVGGDAWTETSPNSGVYVYDVGILPANTTYSIDFPVSIHPDLPAEELLAITNTVEIVDSGTQGDDTVPGNNSAMDLDIVSGPDLAITAFTISPKDPVAGEPLTLDVTVINQGIDDTGVITEAYFLVEVYAKPAEFVPAGPPARPLDHAGGICAGPPEEVCDYRPEYLSDFVAGLAPQAEIALTFVITPTEESIYTYYVQADITYDNDTWPWGLPWGLQKEGNELNNIRQWFPAGPSKVYLPLVTR